MPVELEVVEVLHVVDQLRESHNQEQALQKVQYYIEHLHVPPEVELVRDRDRNVNQEEQDTHQDESGF